MEEEIYLKIKNDITKNIYEYDDQIAAISKWIAKIKSCEKEDILTRNERIKILEKLLQNVVNDFPHENFSSVRKAEEYFNNKIK